jgi:predicted kinase
MPKIKPVKTFLMLFYGYPGAGKTYFARQFCDQVQAAHLQADRIRGELFEKPRYDKQENSIVTHLMNYMSEEFLSSDVSVAYDVNAMRVGQRRALYDMAYRCHAQPILIWFQMDNDTAFDRNQKRDRRRADDKYTASWDRTTFETMVNHMQNPKGNEDYIVVSGKHMFNMQKSAVTAKLRHMGVISDDDAAGQVIKPGMINLIPGGVGRVDMTRRNISIRH